MSNICILDPNRTPLSCTLEVETDMKAGADFKVIDPDTKEIIEHFKLDAVDHRSEVHKFKTKPITLNRKQLVWTILVCSRNPNNFRGKIEVDLSQYGLPVKLSSPTSWTISNIPACKHGEAQKLSGNVTFVLKDDLSEKEESSFD